MRFITFDRMHPGVRLRILIKKINLPATELSYLLNGSTRDSIPTMFEILRGFRLPSQLQCARLDSVLPLESQETWWDICQAYMAEAARRNLFTVPDDIAPDVCIWTRP